MAFGLTDDGYTAPRTSDFLTIIRDSFEASVGVSIDWDSNAFLGNVTSIMAQQLGELGEASQTIYDAWIRANANGLPLDDLGNIVGVPRIEATQSTVDYELTGDATSAGKIVPSGTQFEGGDDSNPVARWTLDEDVTLTGAAAVTTSITSVDFGAIAAAGGKISKIVNPQDGLASATNPAAANEGVALEDDAVYRPRQDASLQITGGRSLNALRANLQALPFVAAAGVIDNPEGFAQVVEGVAMPSHSGAVAVAPFTLTTEQQQIVAETIYNQVPWGIETIGNQNFTVIGADGFAKPVAFFFAVGIPVDVVIVIVPSSGFTLGGLSPTIEAAVTAYFDTLGVGDDVLYHRVFGAVADVEGIESFTLTINGITVNIAISVTEAAFINSQSVT